MRIFIIGPEGAGKTVFLAMLSHYVATERKDLILEPLDYASAEYVTRAQQALHLGEWPPSTRQGELRLLRWNFGTSAAALTEMQMLDSAGQDLRHILLEDQAAILTPDQQAIRQMMDQSDFLIYLLDLGSLLGTQDMLALTENTWLFKTFMTRPEWQGKKRVVVVSKADIYREALAAHRGDVRKLIKHCLPPHLSLSHLMDAKSQISYLVLTSVVTTTEIGEDGNPLRKPGVPLRSKGFEVMLPIMLSSVVAKAEQEQQMQQRAEELAKTNQPIGNRLLNVSVVSAILCWVAFIVIISTSPSSSNSTVWIWIWIGVFVLFVHYQICSVLGGKNISSAAITGAFVGSTIGVPVSGVAGGVIGFLIGGFDEFNPSPLPGFLAFLLGLTYILIGGRISARLGGKISIQRKRKLLTKI